MKVNPVPATPDTPAAQQAIHVHPLPAGLRFALIGYGVLLGLVGVLVLTVFITGQRDDAAAREQLREDVAREFADLTRERDAEDALEQQRTRMAVCALVAELEPTPGVVSLATAFRCPVPPTDPASPRPNATALQTRPGVPGGAGAPGAPGRDGRDAPAPRNGGRGGDDPDPDPTRPPSPPPPPPSPTPRPLVCVDSPLGRVCTPA